MEKKERRRNNLESGSVLNLSLTTGDPRCCCCTMWLLSLSDFKVHITLYHMHLQCRQMPPCVSIVQSNLPSLRWQGPLIPSLPFFWDESSLQAEGPHCLFFHRIYFLLVDYNDDVMQNGPSEWDNTTLELIHF